jgi:hypothetical protein
VVTQLSGVHEIPGFCFSRFIVFLLSFFLELHLVMAAAPKAFGLRDVQFITQVKQLMSET